MVRLVDDQFSKQQTTQFRAILVFSLLAFDVQYTEKRTKWLEPSAPCEYNTAIERVESGREVILRDGFIEQTIHLNAFRKFARKLLSNGAILNEWGMTINETNAEESFPAYVTVENTLSVRFFNCIFVSFQKPLLHTRRDTFLSEIEIHSCHLDRPLSLLTFAGGAIPHRSTVIHEPTIHDCADLGASRGHQHLRFRVVRVPRRTCPVIALFGANSVSADSHVQETSSLQSPFFGVTDTVDVKFSDL
jgi:hypothetical protein